DDDRHQDRAYGELAVIAEEVPDDREHRASGQLHAGIEHRIEDVDQEDGGRDRDDRYRRDPEDQPVVADIDGRDQEPPEPRIAEHELDDDRAVEDRAQRHGKAGDLRHQRIAYDVEGQDSAAPDAPEFGICDIVLGHDVG